MQELTSVRKSGRKRYPSRKYSIDPFEGLEGLSSGSEGNENVKQHAESSDEEVGLAREEASVVPDAYDANQDEAFGSSGDASLAEEDDPDDANDADEASDAGNAIDADANGLSSSLVNVRDSDPVNHATGKDKNLRYKLRPKQYLKGIIRSRGLIELSSKSPSKEDMLKFMAGGHPQDWVDFLRAKERWLSDPTLPTREGDKEGKEAMCYHFSHTDDNRKMEATIGWDWYYDQGGRELFAKRQKVQVLTPDEGRAYMTKPAEPSRKFLMGPYGRQQVFSLETGRSMCLNEAWKPAHETSHPVTEPGSLREGWMLNLGTSVRCLDWATNQDGNVQYLAAATAQPKASPSHGLSEVSPAFTPSLPMRSCIQIWAFAATQAPKHESLLDSRNPPTLQLVICTEWGEIKQLKWCQIPREFRTDDLQNQTPIGLLAGVWTDGLVRVLDIHLEQKGDATSYVKYDEAAFKAWAPNTLCTCVTWLSASNLAVGFANGFLAIWDISEAGTPENKSPATSSPSTTPQKPWLYMPLHQSYILAITSAYPSYPHLISTSSIDGYARLTDLRAPTTDYCLSVRSRSASPLLSFSPSLLSILSTEENDFARLFPLRSFHSSISFARATGSPLSLAANYFHPSVLMGCADGSLIATNPLPRVWNRKWPYYQQVIFRHEWTRGKGGTVGDGGISRITESYKVTKTRTSRTHKPSSSITVTSKARPGAAAKKSQPKLKAKAPTGTAAEGTAGDGNGEPQNGLVLATIHEENTGITQVVWNPNLKCGGWIAAGMGSGLVRVQDLAV